MVKNSLALEVLKELKRRLRRWQIAFWAMAVVCAATISVIVGSKGNSV